MENSKFKLAILASHPIEYQTPLFKKLAENPAVDLTVYFCWDFGLKETYDEGFKQLIKTNSASLLEGYRHKFLKNYSPKPSEHFWGEVNPSIVSELAKNKYDAILVHGYVFLTNWLAFLGAWFTRTPVILRGETDLAKGANLLKRVAKKIILTVLFAGISAFLYSYLRNKEYYRFYGVPERKLFFLPCAVDNDFFRKEAQKFAGQKSVLRKRIGLAHPDWPTVLLAAQLIPRKRPLDLLKACERISPKLKFNLVIVGSGSETEKIQEFVKERQLANVYCAGFKSPAEISPYYSLADIFVLPSEFDPSPKALNEAMNFGLAVVATDKVGTAPDLVAQSESGFIYPVGDTDALAAILEKILSDGKLLLQLQRNARAAVAEWSYDKDVEGVLKALRYLAQK